MKFFQKFFHTHTYRTLLNYFLSYFLILTFLLISFFFLMRNQLSNLYNEKLTEQVGQQLDATSTLFQSYFTTLDQIHSSLNRNTNLILSRNINDDWARYQAQQEIDDYSIGNNLVESIIYYDKRNDIVLSSGKYVEYQDAVFYLYSNNHATAFDPSKYLTDQFLSNQLFYVADTNENYLIYYPYSNATQDYTIFFILNQYEIQNILKNVISDEVTSIGFLTLDGQTATGINTSLLEEQLSSATLSEGKYRLNSGRFLMVGKQMHGGCSLAALVSTDTLIAQLQTAFQRTYFILTALCVIGILLILLAMCNTYLPLHKLTKKIVKDPTPGQSYLEQLDHVYTTALTENQILQDKINKYRLSMQKSILDSIITASPHAIENGMDSIEPFFAMEADNQIFVLCMRSSESIFPYQEVAEFIRNALPKEDTCIVLEGNGDNAVFLLNYSGPEQNKEDVILSLLSNLYEEKGYLAALSKGSSSPLDIPSLYQNAVLSRNHWTQHPIVSSLSIDLESSAGTTFSYPYDTLEKFAGALKEPDFAKSRLHIQKLFQLIDDTPATDNTLPVFFVRCVLIDLLTTLINAMNQSTVRFKAYHDLYFETLYFCRSCSYEETKEKIQANIESLLSLFEAEYESKIITAPQIRQILEENFSSPDFSINLLADTFHVSMAYMSYLFKKEMEINFTDYLWTLRLEKAKELLLTTSMPIDDISIAVGYLNTSSFRRKFKAAMEMTPSQFRSQGRQSENETQATLPQDRAL